MKSLKSRILFVISMLLIYRIGTYIPLPGINSSILSELANANAKGILGMFNMFTGGALGRMSIFALNIMPYITASIVMQLLTSISTEFGNLRKEGEGGRKKLAQYTKYLTLALALFQGYGLAVGAERLQVGSTLLVSDPGFIFRFVAVLSMVGSTVFIMWLTEQITLRGIGNGSSLVIFTGIVAGLPAALASLLEMGRAGTISALFIIFVFLMCTLLVATIVFFEKAQRKIQVHYPKRQVGRKVYGGDSTHLPLKINTAGVLGPIFASSLLLFPTTIIGLLGKADQVGSWQHTILLYLNHGKPLYIVLYVALICFFSFFYTSVVFNAEETAENLKKAGAIIVGRRPGKQTMEYLDYVLTRITAMGAIYVSFICVLPEILISQYALPFYLGGTSLLITVNVVMDIFQQIQTHLLSKQYSSLMKNSAMFLSKK
ncbi:Sec translocon subunit SecY [Alphaproteobacteria bacterium]